jgi:Fic family protein
MDDSGKKNLRLAIKEMALISSGKVRGKSQHPILRTFCTNVPYTRVYSKELIELLFYQPYTKGQSLVDAGIAKRKTAAEYLKDLEKTGILTGKRIGREMLYLNTRLYDLLSK